MKHLETAALTRLGQIEGNLQQKLTALLRSTYTLAVSTHGLHWNVRGPHFVGLHSLFGEIYEDLFETADEIAERILALYPGSTVPINAVELTNDYYLASMGTPEQMVEWLSNALTELSIEFTQVCNTAESVNDQGTLDLCGGEVAEYQSYAWKLRSHIA